MANYREFRNLILDLDQEAWRIYPKALMPQLYPQETARYEDLRFGLTTITALCGIEDAHWCPDWDFLLICDQDPEIDACTCRKSPRLADEYRSRTPAIAPPQEDGFRQRLAQIIHDNPRLMTGI